MVTGYSPLIWIMTTLHPLTTIHISYIYILYKTHFSKAKLTQLYMSTLLRIIAKYYEILRNELEISNVENI